MKRKAAHDSLLALLEEKLEANPAPRYLIGFSGGLDSTVLLHLASRLKERFSFLALHINHRLSPEAPSWEAHCREVCSGLGVPFRSVQVEVRVEKGESLEAAARRARYRAFEEVLGEGEVLLLAHHAGDQSETLLLHLLRGGGVKGLSGIPEVRPLGRGGLLRPLLEVPREALFSYAERFQLSWIEDGSNRDLRFDRNFLRHQVLPLLRRRWPELSRTLSRSARHLAEAQSLLDEIADDWLEEVEGPEGTLLLERLDRFPPKRQRWIVRRWLERHLGKPPSTDQLARVFGEVIAAAPDRMPALRLGGHTLRRYRSALYLLRERPCQERESLEWPSDRETLRLPDGSRLSRLPAVGEGISAARWQRAEVRFRQGGELCRLPGRGRRPLKKLLQELGVPPWQRERIPLLYLNGELAAVADLAVCAPFLAGKGEAGYRLRWEIC